MIANLFLTLGLNRDHVAFVWGKVLSIALLVNSGVFDLSAQAQWLGIPLSPTGAHWIQALAIGALFISGQYSTSSLPGKKLAVWLLVAGLGADVLILPACASAPPLVTAANADLIAVSAVHAVVQAEASAFKAGAYDSARHQTYVAALLKIAQSEKVLTDALKTWNAASGQPMPQIVSIAVQSIQQILTDVTPLIPTNSTIGALAASANAAIAALTGGK